MKKHALILGLLLVFCSTGAFAKIWRVNNNPGITADFTTLQDAHNGAASGDTLHLEGSATHYGSLTSTKKLVILGPGFFLDQNQNTQALKQTAKVQNFQLHSGSDGSVIMGLDFMGSGVYIYASNIEIKRNIFMSLSGDMEWNSGIIYLHYNSSDYSPLSNIVISQNYGVKIHDQNYTVTNLLIANNYLALGAGHGADNTTSPVLNLYTGTVALIQNNIIKEGLVTVHNSTLMNNIMVQGALEGTGNMMSNNLGNNTQFGTLNGNKSNINMSSVFVGAGAGVSSDGKWKLKVGSPAIGAGFGSTSANPVDAGMYSSHTPYVLSGIPPIPAIYFIDVQPVGSNTDPIDVTVKVKSNN